MGPASPGAAPLALVALLALAGSCRSPGTGARPSSALEIGAAALDLSEPRAAESALEPLFADGASRAGAQERFWAGWLLAQARALRALDLPAGSTGEVGAERTGLRVGSLYFAGLAAQERLSVAGTVPAPGGAALRAADAALGLELLRFSLLERLGFEERAEWSAAQVPAPGGAGEVTGILERSGMHQRLHAGVLGAFFEIWARRDPARAFPFAAATLSAADRSPGSLGADEARKVEAWIAGGSPFVFRCPECGQAAVPELRACPNDQTRLERFLAAPRP